MLPPPAVGMNPSGGVSTIGAGSALPLVSTVTVALVISVSVRFALPAVSPPGRYSAIVPLTRTESPGSAVGARLPV
ncbi:hypothetical protein ABZ816_08180 [Actinosynnema sp. NPDC047251]|uniref:hypothetical protein n=1 Tax=Saccharothrix espanaensis TaxID=103731 RepID=UPI0026904482